MEGRPYARRLSKDEYRLVEDLTKNVPPRDILSILKAQNENNVSTIKDIYNAQYKIRKALQVGKSRAVLRELHRLNDHEFNHSTCGCQLRKSCGLPCACELLAYLNSGEAIPLDSVDIFLRISGLEFGQNCPPKSEPHETIVIAHVNGNHYIKATLHEGCLSELIHFEGRIKVTLHLDGKTPIGGVETSHMGEVLFEKRKYFSEMPNQTRWIKAVPIKINVLAWKVSLDCLPTRLNISRRGIDIPSILCPICDSVVESSSHLFFGCSLAKDILRRICRWWNVEFSDINSYAEWSSWIVALDVKRPLVGSIG
ncbi:RNA-directed DNA polymerase, eukaryota [Tanacetum coccineum]